MGTSPVLRITKRTGTLSESAVISPGVSKRGVSSWPGCVRVRAGTESAAAYLTASRPHQQALFPALTERSLDRIDAIYMTRAQRERHAGESLDGYPVLSGDSLRASMFKDTKVMHPLPRLGEIDHALDKDPRAVYFQQAGHGVPIRMALMAFLLRRIELRASPPEPRRSHLYVSGLGGFVCRNKDCVTNGDGKRYLSHEFFELVDDATLLSCAFCGKAARPHIVGDRNSLRFAPADSTWGRGLERATKVFFASEDQAKVAGFAPQDS